MQLQLREHGQPGQCHTRHTSCTLTSTSSPMSTASRESTTATSPNEEDCARASYQPPTVYEPNVLERLPLLRDFSDDLPGCIRRQIQSPRTSVTRNSTMRPSEKRCLHHCSFSSEKNQRTGDTLRNLLKKGGCQLSPFTHERGDPYTNLVRLKNGSQVATWKTKESGISLKDKSKFSLKSEQRFRSTISKPFLIEAFRN